MVNCDFCGRELANSVYHVGGDKVACPICVLGEEGSQQKYWETSKAKNAGKPEGFRYADDTAKYRYTWNGAKQKWLDKDGFMRPEWDEEKQEWKEPVKG